MIDSADIISLFKSMYENAKENPAYFYVSEETYRSIIRVRLIGRLYQQWRKESKRRRYAKRRKYERM